jgi:enediyne polyketide synthase
MHVAGEASAGPGEAVAITGAAVRFPGASDPWSFHELTVAGRPMFRELGAALLDDGPYRLGRDDELTGGITARHVLAAQTAAAALADVPPLGRLVAPGRIGVFFADVPEPGTADVARWVRRQLRLRAGDPGRGPAPADSLEAASAASAPGGGSRRARVALKVLVLGAADAMSTVHGAGPDGRAGRGSGVPPGGQHCSLRAVTAACEALSSGEFDLVLAGGVARGAGRWARRPAAGGPAAGRDQYPVRVYDASPSGTLPGEGCGVAVLMRAADARARQVPAYAEIAGWHYAGPGTASREVLPPAYLRAGIDPRDIQLVEGHGAATAADDLAELSALLEVLGPRAGSAARGCALGSVAANIGDTRAASGIAALLKAAFAMTADVIPPAAGCVRPNKLLRGAGTPFRLPSVAEQWPQTPVQLAAVNSLGAAAEPGAPRSGPVHVVLRRERDEARRPGRRRKPALAAGSATP